MSAKVTIPSPVTSAQGGGATEKTENPVALPSEFEMVRFRSPRGAPPEI
jgi:hypothetical protein